jgi:hypothetical protein
MLSELDYTQLGEKEEAAPKRRDLLDGEEHSPDHRVGISATTGAPIRKATTAASVPYYLTGRTPIKTPTDEEYDEEETFRSILKSSIEPIPLSQDNWVLYKRLMNRTRNHDNVVFDVEPSGRQVLLVLLGRWSESIQWVDLLSGKRNLSWIHSRTSFYFGCGDCPT